MTGFLEESVGVRSMTRLTILIVCVLSSAVVATVCYVAVRKPDAAVIGALGGVLLTLVAKGAVAIINRNSGDDK